MSLPYSSMRVDGTATRIKTATRPMVGQASFLLLRRRILLAGNRAYRFTHG
jgi:transposase